ncbi:MAG: threonine--tRNA ligase [Thermaerobacter sp.]|nr:threonine--tRNA ligase [Thermaerobacter sp.]
MQVSVDGKLLALDAGATYGDLAQAVGVDALAARQDGRIYELFRPIAAEGAVELLRFEDPDGAMVFHHTSTHMMAQAVRRLFPDAQFAIGPANAEGFFYDMQLPHQLGPDDFPAIEAEMRRIAESDYAVTREVLPRREAEALFREMGETYKLEIVARLPEDAEISIYRQGEFVDLCRGPHLSRTGLVRAPKVLSVAGAYFAGDESRPMLQRLYGTSFPTEEGLEEHLRLVEEAKRRDHRRLGRELDLFTFHDVAPGFAFWQPAGTTVYHELEAFSREVQARYGYREVMTPWIFRPDLWQTSGHWGHYQQNMFIVESEDETVALKPMNCPGHCLMFAETVRSYRDLPLRLAEYGPLSRFERSGTLHGLLRVRGFHQDDAHIFLREDQIGSGIEEVLEILRIIYGTFGLQYRVELSTRPEEYLGELALWERAEGELASSLERAGLPFRINKGDGAFYGPKIDVHVIDALGRQWQCATVQLDFQFPLRFHLEYRDQEGKAQTPVMVHRAIFGSIERFIGILLEHFAGAFPSWLAPLQARVLPVSDRHREYAEAVTAELRAQGLRAEADLRDEKLGYKIRAAQADKVPYFLVVGDREAEDGTVSVRARGEAGSAEMSHEVFVRKLAEEVQGRRLQLTAHQS